MQRGNRRSPPSSPPPKDAGRIGDPVDCVKQTDHASCIDETGRAYCLAQRGARTGKRRLVVAEHRFGERNEQAAMRNTAIALCPSRHRFQIVCSIVGHAARTEQQSVTGRSIETLVQG